MPRRQDANSFLLDQFMKDDVNGRSNEWSMYAVVADVGPHAGICLSMYPRSLDCSDSDPNSLAVRMARELNKRNM
ncbi:hypothetical protein E2562_013732 [Oryza meyeriana var. granulata]|uniref:Uncharacterized protein n=1 Tax=Oryza meyeriana var. granulata TaxID=110450 RepID=A0A6G1BJR9_9ORYZ|nr:hypothetical protein E2562_013732 [Oryza meyeriana var. granulata]